MGTILKCKMCGGDIEVNINMSIGTCMFCGSTMTLPRIDNEKKMRLFNRANQYRLNCEFDKAYETYQAIATEDEQEAEAYWGMILSEYGVEYVEDPTTKKRVPTCHRTHITSIKSTTNYNLACKYADAESRFLYRDEAEELDQIQKSILAISSKEEPYDVFICYKESDVNTGERTKDSVIAQEIYNELTKQNVKVFYSRITLSEKLGSNYEPFIFSALNSARIMLVISTSNANVNSIWVKNEWSRFLHFMQTDSNKVLIPVYQDMEIYELPDELNKFQAQDYSKVGAIQDIAYSVKKLISSEEREKNDTAIKELIQEKEKREERREKQTALTKKIAFCSAVFVILAVVAFVCIKLYRNILYPNSMYSKALKMMEQGEYDTALVLFETLGGYKESATQISEAKYLKAVDYMEQREYDQAISVLNDVAEYKDSANLISLCLYNKGLVLFDSKDYEEAIKILEPLGDYESAKDLVVEGKVQLQLLSDVYEDDVATMINELSEEQLYKIGSHLVDLGDYSNAIIVLSKCIGYEDSMELCKASYYEVIIGQDVSKNMLNSLSHLASGMTIQMLAPDTTLADCKYDRAQRKLDEIVRTYYEAGLAAYNKKDWISAKDCFSAVTAVDYMDAAKLLDVCNSKMAAEVVKFNGIWKKAKGDNLIKIKDGKIWESKSTMLEKVWDERESRYDGNANILIMTDRHGAEKALVVSGDVLTVDSATYYFSREN